MKQIRDMAGMRQKLTIWAPRDQREHMAQACQRARVDHDLLPQARRLLDLPSTGNSSPDDSWKELLRKAFTDVALQSSMHCARERAKARVEAALKEIGVAKEQLDSDDDAYEPKVGCSNSIQQGRACATLDRQKAFFQSYGEPSSFKIT